MKETEGRPKAEDFEIKIYYYDALIDWLESELKAKDEKLRNQDLAFGKAVKRAVDKRMKALKSERENEILVPKYKFKTIENALRLAMNVLKSRSKKDQTAMDRELLLAERYINESTPKTKEDE